MQKGHSVRLVPIEATWWRHNEESEDGYSSLRYEAPSGESVVIADVMHARWAIYDVFGYKITDVEWFAGSLRDNEVRAEARLRERGIIS